MPEHVALLGRINVGNNQLKMADLRAVLTDAGFANVGTVVASGNVVFDHPAADDPVIERKIAEIIFAQFGIESRAFVRSRRELAALIAETPFLATGQENLVHVFVLESQPGAVAFAQLEQDHAGRGNERIAAGTRALHVDYIDGVGNSKLTAAFIERRLGCPGTARNMRSLKRILEKMEA